MRSPFRRPQPAVPPPSASASTSQKSGEDQARELILRHWSQLATLYADHHERDSAAELACIGFRLHGNRRGLLDLSFYPECVHNSLGMGFYLSHFLPKEGLLDQYCPGLWKALDQLQGAYTPDLPPEYYVHRPSAHTLLAYTEAAEKEAGQ